MVKLKLGFVGGHNKRQELENRLYWISTVKITNFMHIWPWDFIIRSFTLPNKISLLPEHEFYFQCLSILLPLFSLFFSVFSDFRDPLYKLLANELLNLINQQTNIDKMHLSLQDKKNISISIWSIKDKLLVKSSL